LPALPLASLLCKGFLLCAPFPLHIPPPRVSNRRGLPSSNRVGNSWGCLYTTKSIHPMGGGFFSRSVAQHPPSPCGGPPSPCGGPPNPFGLRRRKLTFHLFDHYFWASPGTPAPRGSPDPLWVGGSRTPPPRGLKRSLGEGLCSVWMDGVGSEPAGGSGQRWPFSSFLRFEIPRRIGKFFRR